MNYIFNINVCRVCLQNDQSCDLWSDKVLLEKFKFTTNLQITKEDNLPKAICSRCTIRLKIAYTFITTAHESERNLKKFLEKINSEFKEVSQGNKSNKKFLNEQSLAEDELLSLIDEEHHEDNLTGTDIIDENSAKFHTELELKILNADNIQSSRKVDLGKCKVETGYSFSQDTLVLHAVNEIERDYENNSNFIETPTLNNADKDHYNEEVECHELEKKETYPNIKILETNEESVIRSQSAELTIEESEENDEYDVIINSQDTIHCENIYIEESSVEENNEADVGDLNTNNLHGEEEMLSNLDKNKEIYESFPKKRIIAHRFYCEKCNRDFSTKTNLNRHMQSHEGNKPFSCAECKKSFTQKSTLKQHMYTHTGERPYVCEVCNRGFTQCKSLIFHMRRHTGEKPFHCEYCFITFRQKDALRIHIFKHHVVVERAMDGTEIFSCIICKKKFSTKLEFKTHMKVHTASGEVDNVEIFPNEKEKLLTKASKKTCETGTFSNTEYFSAVVVKVSASSAAEPGRAKKFQCRKCFKCFALKKSLVRHMRIHYIKDVEQFDCN